MSNIYKEINKSKTEFKASEETYEIPKNQVMTNPLEEMNVHQGDALKEKDLFSHESGENAQADLILSEIQQDRIINEEALKKERKDLVKSLSNEESNEFSLVDRLEYNPYKMRDWLKASAEVNGASKSFKEVIDTFDKFVEGNPENIQMLSIQLQNAADFYLHEHSKKPYHLYGRQRVTMCKEIVKNINVLPTKLMWQKQQEKAHQDFSLGNQDAALKQMGIEDEATKSQEPIYENMVEEVMSITEKDIDKMLLDPEYALKNTEKLTRLSAIYSFAFKKDYFSKLPPIIQEKFSGKMEIINLITSQYLPIAAKQGDLEALNTVAEQINGFKNNVFEVNKELEVDESAPEEDQQVTKKVNAYFDARLFRGNEANIKKLAEDGYDKIDSYIKQYFKDGNITLPPIKEARQLLYNSSLEEKVGLFILLAQVSSFAVTMQSEAREGVDEKTSDTLPKVSLPPEYQEIYDKLQTGFAAVKTDANASSDDTALNESDAMKLGFLAASFGHIARQRFYQKLDQALSGLNLEGKTEEEIEEARTAEMMKLANTTDGYLFERTNGMIAVSASSIAQEANDLVGKYMVQADGFNEHAISSARGQASFDKMKSKNKTRRGLNMFNQEVDLPYNPYSEEVQKENVIFGKKLLESGIIKQSSIKNDGTDRDVLPAVKNRITKKELAEIIKRERASEGPVPKEVDYKRIKYSSSKDKAAIKRAKARFSNGENISDAYSAQSETMINALLSNQQCMKYYYDNSDFTAEYARADGYYLCYLQEEDFEKSEGQLTAEEKNIRKWDKKFVDNYYKYTNGDEQGIYDMHTMMIERLDEMMRFELNPENLMDGNWIVANYQTLDKFSMISLYFDNVMENKKSEALKERLQELPYYDLLMAKIKAFVDLGAAVRKFKEPMGIGDKYGVPEYDAERYFMSNSDYIANEDSGVPSIEQFKSTLLPVFADIEEYRKIRDSKTK